jgi:geranylgeranyl diphosphate synthase type I
MTADFFQDPQIIAMRQAIEQDLKIALAHLRAEKTEGLTDMIDYHFGWQDETSGSTGKRIRPLITLLCCAATNGEWQTALPAASAVEIIHNFSLIHDDIEDLSSFRRGRMTVWKKWGIPKAINLGDALFALSRLTLFRLGKIGLPHARILNVIEVLDRACTKLTIGQQLDLAYQEREHISEENYLGMISGKTSALLSAAAACGGIIAGGDAEVIDLLEKYGNDLGLAFQIQDDILGIWGDSAKTGKDARDDLYQKKKTLPIVYALQNSPDFRESWNSGQRGSAAYTELYQLLDVSRAQNYAQSKAEECLQRALSRLDGLRIKNEFQVELQNLTLRLLNRKA